jgi:cytochrome b subunit of formate dehydrogenase
MIKEEIKTISSSEKDLRNFGLSVGGVLVIIGLVLLYFSKVSYPFFLAVGGILILLGLIIPKILLPFQKIWMAFAIVLGFIMTRIILSILFYLIITPIGLIAKLFKKDFLDRKIQKDKASYWNYREIKEYQKIDTERQF